MKLSDENNLYTWNDSVLIKSNAPSSYFPGKSAAVCGIEQVKSQELASEFEIKIGDWLYTVEFGDGSSIEVPEIYLQEYKY